MDIISICAIGFFIICFIAFLLENNRIDRDFYGGIVSEKRIEEIFKEDKIENFLLNTICEEKNILQTDLKLSKNLRIFVKYNNSRMKSSHWHFTDLVTGEKLRISRKSKWSKKLDETRENLIQENNKN